MGDFDVMLVMPVICLTVYGLLGLLVTPWLRGVWLALVSLVGLGMTGAFLARLWIVWRLSGPLETAEGLVRIDGFGLFVSFVLLLVSGLTVLYSVKFLEREEADQGEFYPLLLFCLAGMLMMLHTTHLLMVLVGLEVFSLSLYVLTGLMRLRPRSAEAALKYFLLGAFSSGFIVYGMALLYGAAGALDLGSIGRAARSAPGPLLWVGLGLVLIGLAFKIAAVPFHQWVPDVYQGAPTNVAGFMAAATKTAAFAVLLRLLVGALGHSADVWGPVVWWLAVATMTVANLVALAQTNLKRLLAFSSIAHAGYLLIAVVCRPVDGPEEGVRAILFYLTTYGLMTVGAFAVLAAGGRGDADGERGYALDDWAGLGWRRPALGLALSLFLFSLAGLPPTGGFLGKYVIFQTAVRSEQYALAVIGVLNAAVAAYYYLRVVVTLYMTDERAAEPGEEPLPISVGTAVVLFASAAGVLYLGLAPGRLLDLLRDLATSLV